MANQPVAPLQKDNSPDSLRRDLDCLLRSHQLSILDWDSVQTFLKRYRRLIEAVRECAYAARAEFPDAKLELTLYRDPEEGDEYVVIYVRYCEYPPDILERVHSVRRQIRARQREILGNSARLLFLMTDFQPPNNPQGDCDDN